METSWKSDDVSSKFDKYNDMLEDILGFSFLFDIIENDNSIRVILDYGCGPGKVSERLSFLESSYEIIAVDESETMFNIAKNRRQYPKIKYNLIANNSLDFIDDGSIDCVILCFVIINNKDEHNIQAMIREINRVLKTNGKLLILDSNPDATGLDFITFRNGDANINYENGSRKKQYLKILNDSNLVLHDFYWSKKFYETVLRNANFEVKSVIEPTIEELSPNKLIGFENKYQFSDWNNEKKHAPFIIFESTKK